MDSDERHAEGTQPIAAEPDCLSAPALSHREARDCHHPCILRHFSHLDGATFNSKRRTRRPSPIHKRVSCWNNYFGGGPVVIPLLREYVVEQGWVSSRGFLIGLAIIQAFPGPNFNCE